MSLKGVTIGVDTFRTGIGNITRPGFDSLMLVRYASEMSSTVQEAVDVMAKAQRGVSWLYPMCDHTGECAIVESGQYYANDSDFHPYDLVTDKKLKALLPPAEKLMNDKSNVIIKNGLYVRP